MADATRNIRLLVQYDGSRYLGWQRQTRGETTIQAKLEAVLSRMAGEAVNVIGASRTDAGVHAEAQVANFHTRSPLPAQEIVEYCFRYLPEDIVVRSALEVPERFHARYLARSKLYVYRIRNHPQHDVFRRRYEYHVPDPLDPGAMRTAAALLLGHHDFASFCAARSGSKSTIRDLDRAEVTTAGGLVEIAFESSAFLHGMARIMAGTLIEAGRGRIAPEEISRILARAERKSAGFTAPAHGLCLVEIRYDPPFAL